MNIATASSPANKELTAAISDFAKQVPQLNLGSHAGIEGLATAINQKLPHLPVEFVTHVIMNGLEEREQANVSALPTIERLVQLIDTAYQGMSYLDNSMGVDGVPVKDRSIDVKDATPEQRESLGFLEKLGIINNGITNVTFTDCGCSLYLALVRAKQENSPNHHEPNEWTHFAG